MTKKYFKDMDYRNIRKAHRAWCGRLLEKGQGGFMLGHVSKKPFYVCVDGKGCDKKDGAS